MVNLKSANLSFYYVAGHFLKLGSFAVFLALIMGGAESGSAGAGGLMSSYGRRNKDCSGDGGGGAGCAIGSRWRGIRKGSGQGRGGGVGSSSCDAGGGGGGGGGYYDGGQGKEALIIVNQQLLANISLILYQQLEKQGREGGRQSSGYGNTAPLSPPSKSPSPQNPYQIQILGHPQGYDWTQLLRLK